MTFFARLDAMGNQIMPFTTLTSSSPASSGPISSGGNNYYNFIKRKAPQSLIKRLPDLSKTDTISLDQLSIS